MAGGVQGSLNKMVDSSPPLKMLRTTAQGLNQKLNGGKSWPGTSLLGTLLGLNGDRPSWITDSGPAASGAPPTGVNGTLLGPDATKRLGLGG